MPEMEIELAIEKAAEAAIVEAIGTKVVETAVKASSAVLQ
jgi:hypothetical protein